VEEFSLILSQVFPHPTGYALLFKSLICVTGIYGASKSAVMYIADVLKYEMYPFNVKVLNICTGGVKSHMPTNTTKNFDHSIPPNSVYHPIADTVAHAQDGRTEKFMDTKEYTRYVVDKVNAATKSGWIWRGAYATSVWFVNTFLWRSALDSIHLKENGLYELKKSVEKEKGKAQ
jgi:1-acylglycerone phosphate reductase